MFYDDDDNGVERMLGLTWGLSPIKIFRVNGFCRNCIQNLSSPPGRHVDGGWRRITKTTLEILPFVDDGFLVVLASAQ